MSKTNKNITIVLDKEEQFLEDNIEKLEPLDEKEFVERTKMLMSYAKKDLSAKQKKRNILIRMESEDLEALTQYAKNEGLNCQSLIKSILHKFLTGQLKNKIPA